MDITKEEFVKFYLTNLAEDNEKPSKWHKRVGYPDSKDWTETEGAV